MNIHGLDLIFGLVRLLRVEHCIIFGAAIELVPEILDFRETERRAFLEGGGQNLEAVCALGEGGHRAAPALPDSWQAQSRWKSHDYYGFGRRRKQEMVIRPDEAEEKVLLA